MKRLLSSFTLALAMLLMLVGPTQTQAASQTTDFDHVNDDALVSFDGPADLAAANVEVFIHAHSADANRTDGIDRTQTVDGNSTTETAGALTARTRAQTPAGNGIEGSGDLYCAIERKSESATTSPVIFMSVLKLDQSPLMAPNSEYRHVALKSSNNVVNVNLASFRIGRLSTVQIR
jgi:hypothetical protein